MRTRTSAIRLVELLLALAGAVVLAVVVCLRAEATTRMSPSAGSVGSRATDEDVAGKVARHALLERRPLSHQMASELRGQDR